MSTILGDILTFSGSGAGSSNSGGEVWGVISITYPTGSTCTVTNGTITFTASNTNGSVIFSIPEPNSTPEIWTASCMDGTDNDSTTISMNQQGQIEEIELAYRISFAIRDKYGTTHTYQAGKGMTWAEWGSSNYNTDNLTVAKGVVGPDGRGVSYGDYDGHYIEDADTEVIIANYTYYTSNSPR